MSHLAQRDTEWELKKDGPIVSVALVVAALFVLWAALALWPFAGVLAVWVLGVAGALLFNASLGSLAVGGYIEIRHPRWSCFHGIDHVVLYVALVLLAAVDVVLTWWLFGQTASWVRWGFLGLAAVGILAGGLLSWTHLWPRRESSPGHQGPESKDPRLPRWPLLGVLSAFLGVGAGVILAAGIVIGSAVYRNAATPDVAPDAVPIVHGINGSYVAIGDSYSAGQGLAPFEPATVVTSCDRSQHAAYPDILRFAQGNVPVQFTACSGAIVSEVLHPRGGSHPLPPQVDGHVHPGVGLVTVTIGGNNALFSKIVIACFAEANCLTSTFPAAGDGRGIEPVAPSPLASTWAPATILDVGKVDAVLFRSLRTDFPNARIVVVGYPYLFPDSPAGLRPDYCASILRRFSRTERTGIRALEDEFNNLTYEETVASHIEFVSPGMMWRGHEPCGDLGQYTNSIKPYLSFANPIDGGSFHPNSAGQRTLAALLGCYLNAYRKPPDPYQDGGSGPLNIPAARLASPSQLGLVNPPGAHTSVRGCQ